MKNNNSAGRSPGSRRGKNKPIDAVKKTKPKGIFHSRVTAGLTLLPSIDGRSTWARIMRDTYHAMLAHSGGADYVPETKRLMARRIAAFEAELINLEDRFASLRAQGEEPTGSDLVLYGQLVGHQRRCCDAVGWERTCRDVTPTLGELLRRDHARRLADDVEEIDA